MIISIGILFLVFLSASDINLNVRKIGFEDGLKETIYVISIDGVIYAMNLGDGQVLWRRHDMHVLNITQSSEGDTDFRRFMIPNPTDGSLYSLVEEGRYPFLNRVPANIQELVAKSPFTFSNGIYQVGYKRDILEEICSESGKRLVTVSHTHDCLAEHGEGNTFVLSKTQYNLALFSLASKENLFNITYIQYNFEADAASAFLFLAAPSGWIACVYTPSSKVLWKVRIDSVAVHVFKGSKKMSLKLPLLHLPDQVINDLDVGDLFDIDSASFSVAPFQSTCNTYAYALPALSPALALLRTIDIPQSVAVSPYVASENDSLTLFSGYLHAIANLFEGQPPAPRVRNGPNSLNTISQVRFVPIFLSLSLTVVTLVTIVFLAIFKKQDLDYRKLLAAKDLDSKNIIGKIVFDPESPLGQGSNGTFVFRGRFESRSVAVKRILATSSEIAELEIKTLRESDQHPNVIRYFATENDNQFFYIALELCRCTLYEYITDPSTERCDLGIKDIVLQAATGLHHLHQLRIIHRDLKPHNILISNPNHANVSRVLISDFGLSKKVPLNKASLTNGVSTAAGTIGWIAPEVYLNTKKSTFASDVFSLGCIIYFVLSEGIHPFGDELHRQYNIQTNIYDIGQFSKGINRYEAQDLIIRMIAHSLHDRITCDEVVSHFFFWEKQKRVQFLMDFSNHTEDLSNTHPDILKLENNSLEIVRGSWAFHIPSKLLSDLSTHRDYSPTSVRDLVRAIRNKTNHFKDTPRDVKKYFKNNPNNIVTYFSETFPRFLIHLYNTSQKLGYSRLEVFKHYFSNPSYV
ncbi:Serine/threonine-protein kinase/endoribonuclease IRE2 [Thelohanellus kitauei]|uniref:non-specific serine/threonine protein kinase n=1 Tax=Thelohanellus kitauei TaxID=669202 RepID=A0A0C2NKQ0_THEKT|nr:Serine/threonine-protein kinase/endoribonuclease IRE2 [Thelohanellus kitauei]